jgi:hypothetical protein
MELLRLPTRRGALGGRMGSLGGSVALAVGRAPCGCAPEHAPSWPGLSWLVPAMTPSFAAAGPPNSAFPRPTAHTETTLFVLTAPCRRSLRRNAWVAGTSPAMTLRPVSRRHNMRNFCCQQLTL